MNKKLLELYDKIRAIHKETPYSEEWMPNTVKNSLETLDGVFYLVESLIVVEEANQ